MGLFPEEIEAVTLHLDGERLGVSIAEDVQAFHLQLRGLPPTLTLHKLPNRFHGRAGVKLSQDLLFSGLFVDNELQILQR